MVDRTRRKVNKRVDNVEINFRTLGALLDDVKNKIALYGEDARVDEYQHEYDETTYQGGIFVTVDETDDEMNKRISREENWEKQSAERDRKEFERLKAKFGS